MNSGAAPPRSAGPIQISGCPGFSYDSSMITTEGVPTEIHVVMVRWANDTIASVIRLTAKTISAEDFSMAAVVLATAKLVPPCAK